MKSVIISCIIIALACQSSHANPNQQPFKPIGEIIVLVVSDYIAKRTRAESLFSVALHTGSDVSSITSLPASELENLKSRIPDRWEYYISPEELRYPEHNEKDPDGGEAPRFRRIETKDGQTVSVFLIRGLQYLGPHQIQLDWDYGSGPLTGQGGTMQVTWSDEAWKITTIRSYDR